MRLKDVTPLDVVRLRLVENISNTHVNGGVQFGKFELEIEEHRLIGLLQPTGEKAIFFKELFLNHDVIKRLGDISIRSDVPDDLGFVQEPPFVGFGSLASILSSGGAYRKFNGTDAELISILIEFYEKTFSENISEVRCFFSREPWSSWHRDVAWDASFVWLELDQKCVTVLLIADAD